VPFSPHDESSAEIAAAAYFTYYVRYLFDELSDELPPDERTYTREARAPSTGSIG
jgi:hypothetical protein